MATAVVDCEGIGSAYKPNRLDYLKLKQWLEVEFGAVRCCAVTCTASSAAKGFATKLWSLGFEVRKYSRGDYPTGYVLTAISLCAHADKLILVTPFPDYFQVGEWAVQQGVGVVYATLNFGGFLDSDSSVEIRAMPTGEGFELHD